LKIAINIENFSKEKGGAEVYAVGLAQAMAERGHEVHILAYSWYKNCEKDFCCHKIPKALFRTFRDLKFTRHSQKELGKEKFDLCLSLSRTIKTEIYQPHGGVHKAFLQKELKSFPNPFIKLTKSFLRKISLRHFLINRIEEDIFNKRDIIVVALSKMVRSDILSFYEFPEDKIKVIYNGVDLKKFSLENKNGYRNEIRNRHSIEDEDLLILFIANNFRLKGLSNLMHAAALMKKNIHAGFKFRVLVLGGGKKSPYERLALKLGCRDEFTFIGKIKEIEKFYAAADVLAQPTFYDVCSLATLEAMASGLPVVTTSHNGSGELINDGENGFILDDPLNFSELSKKLLIFLDRNFRNKVGANARKKVENHSIHKNTEEILMLCEEVTQKKRKIEPQSRGRNLLRFELSP